ncbi:hypothetical protein VPH35_043297 [Triticum aestivum]
MPPPLRDMLPLAATATECRLTGLGTIRRRTNQKQTPPVHSARARPPHRRLRSRSACRDEIHWMLTRTPALRGFDLAATNWDGGFLPDDLAGTITERARLDEEGHHGGDAPRFSLDLSLTVFVRAVCKLLALACREAAAQCGLSDQDTAAAEGGNDDGNLRLPCSHTFHVRCLARWFEKVTTCPLCRRDMVVHVEAAYAHESKAVAEKLKAIYRSIKLDPDC